MVDSAEDREVVLAAEASAAAVLGAAAVAAFPEGVPVGVGK